MLMSAIGTNRTSMLTLSMHAAWPAILIPADGFC